MGLIDGRTLGWARLFNADLKYADLRGADLSKADLSGADLMGANLRFAFFFATNLEGTKNLKYVKNPPQSCVLC
jgi:uncharacterized protein YjbI with pentapeptide repeats